MDFKSRPWFFDAMSNKQRRYDNLAGAIWDSSDNYLFI